MSDLPARLRAAADESAERWADATELEDYQPEGFKEADRRASDLERLLREAANEIEALRNA